MGADPPAARGSSGGAPATTTSSSTPRSYRPASDTSRFTSSSHRASRGGAGTSAGHVRPRPGSGSVADSAGSNAFAAHDVPRSPSSALHRGNHTTRGYGPSNINTAGVGTHSSGGNPIWIKTSVLEHYLSEDGNGGAALGQAVRRQFGRNNRRFGSPSGASLTGMDGAAADGAGIGGSGRMEEDWGWVRGWAIPAGTTTSPTGSGGANNDASGSGNGNDCNGAIEAGDPVSPFGHVKLRRVGSAASPGFASEQNGTARSPSSTSPAFVHRSNSTPIPNGRHNRQRQTAEDESKPALPLTITIQDEDYLAYTGKAITISSEDVRDGTAPANSWWSTTNVTAATPMMPPDDLIELTHLHEPAVVHCLRTRYDAGEVYTNTGPILLACNPFRTIGGLYSAETMRRYWQRQGVGVGDGDAGRLPPHAFGVADAAFRAMMRSFEDGRLGDVGGDQSILVSGESGAGKTVTTKIVMRYLATLSQQSSDHSGERGGGEGGIEGQVLQSNPILER